MPIDTEPFARIYDKVSGRMSNYRDTNFKKGDGDYEWFSALMDGFKVEYDKWNASVYPTYWAEWESTHGKVPSMAAGAYFHIAYDLPRVIADHWRQGHKPPPNEERSEAIYLDVTHIFLQVFREAARDPKIVGWWAAMGVVGAGWEWITRSDNAFAAATQWVLYLRTAAWIHGRRLHLFDQEKPSRREETEANMLVSLTKALHDAHKWTPLMAAKLAPPLLYKPGGASGVSAVAGFELPWPTWRLATALLAIAAVVTTAFIWWVGRRRRAEWIFVILFGRLLAAYLNVAFSSRNFAIDLELLRAEMGPPRG